MVQKLDQKISSLFSSGVVRYLIDKYFDTRFMKVGTMTDNKIKEICFDNVAGAFILWTVMLMLSFVVFCLEKIVVTLWKEESGFEN